MPRRGLIWARRNLTHIWTPFVCSWRARERQAMTAMNANSVLLVDDDKDICANLSDILTDLGYTVDVAHEGKQALDLFSRKPYRLALLDYKLPDMTGVELFQRMRQIRDKINGLLVTGYASDETAEWAISAGLRHVVHKPIDVPRLMPLIEEVFAS